jgi:hypothetical protein
MVFVNEKYEETGKSINTINWMEADELSGQ